MPRRRDAPPIFAQDPPRRSSSTDWVALMAAASSVMSMPTGHQVMQRPQPTQPDVPNWSIQFASLWVIHCRYREAVAFRTLPPWMYEKSRVKHESHFLTRSAFAPVRSER